MEIDLLGRFAVRRGGRAVETVEFGGRRVRQLVRILAAERGRVVSRDVLIEALWGEQSGRASHMSSRDALAKPARA